MNVVNNAVTDRAQNARRAIDSLASKSETALQKLEPGTWQHTMLRDNLRALRIAASVLMNGEAAQVHRFARDDLEHAIRALATMITRTESAMAKFAVGTSQHTLQRNRLDALRLVHGLATRHVDKPSA